MRPVMAMRAAAPAPPPPDHVRRVTTWYQGLQQDMPHEAAALSPHLHAALLRPNRPQNADALWQEALDGLFDQDFLAYNSIVRWKADAHANNRIAVIRTSTLFAAEPSTRPQDPPVIPCTQVPQLGDREEWAMSMCVQASPTTGLSLIGGDGIPDLTPKMYLDNGAQQTHIHLQYAQQHNLCTQKIDQYVTMTDGRVTQIAV